MQQKGVLPITYLTSPLLISPDLILSETFGCKMN